MNKTCAALTLAFASVAAHAAPVVNVTNTVFSPVAGVCTVDFDGSACSSIAFAGGQLRSESARVAARPPGSTGNFMSVGPGSAGGTPAVFTVFMPETARYNYFGFLAGSLDSYNAITFNFVNGEEATRTYSGTELASLAGVPANGDQGVSRYFSVFLTEGVYRSITLTSTQDAFEVDNLAFGAASVPAPGVLALLGIGLFAAGAASRRRG